MLVGVVFHTDFGVPGKKKKGKKHQTWFQTIKKQKLYCRGVNVIQSAQACSKHSTWSIDGCYEKAAGLGEREQLQAHLLVFELQDLLR